MSTQITYTDKVALTTSAVPDYNQVEASDMNQIKSAINANAVLTDTNTTNISANKNMFVTQAIAVANVVSNSDGLASIYPYKYDLTASVTANHYARTRPSAEADVSVFTACCDGSTQTFAGSIRLYFSKVPTAAFNMNVEYWLGNEVSA